MGVTVEAKGRMGLRRVNFRMKEILRLLLLSTFFVSCLSAPKFHLIETVDGGEEGGKDEAGSSQEGEGEEEGVDNRRLVDKVGRNQEDRLEDGDFNDSYDSKPCTFLLCGR